MTDNPQAFPVPPAFTGLHGDLYMPTEGMTLRDHFAGLAMAAIIQNEGFASINNGIDCPSNDAQRAYLMADAMLAERAKVGKP